MLALIAGTGALPGTIARKLMAQGTPPVVCAMAGFPPDLPQGLERLDFRLETVGSLLAELRARGVRQICMAGHVRRPETDPAAVDAATAPLMPALVAALPLGNDGTLRAILAIIEGQGFTIVGPDIVAPDLVLAPGIPTRAQPGAALRASLPRDRHDLDAMSRVDESQARVIRDGKVIAREGPDGTDALMRKLPPGSGGFLYKAPKPGQEMRVDLPAIGPGTARAVVDAGLEGLAVIGGATLMIERDETLRILDEAGAWLWAVEPGRP